MGTEHLWNTILVDFLAQVRVKFIEAASFIEYCLICIVYAVLFYIVIVVLNCMQGYHLVQASAFCVSLLTVP